MPLISEVVHIETRSGVDTKSDEKLVVPGQLTDLKNGRFIEGGNIQKRNGYTAMTTDIDAGGNIANGTRLGKFKDELLLFDEEDVYTRIDAGSEWTAKGKVSDVDVRFRSIFKGERVQEAVDMASLAGYEVYAWEDSEDKIHATAIDTATGAHHVYDQILDTDVNAANPKVIALASVIVILWLEPNSNELRGRTFTPATASFSGSTTVIATDVSGSALRSYDATEVEGEVAILYDDSTSAQSTIIKIDDTLAITTGPVTIAADGGALSTSGILFAHDVIFCVINDSTVPELKCVIKNKTTLADVVALFSVVSTSGTFYRRITGTVNPDTASDTVWYYEKEASSEDLPDLYGITITASGTVGTEKLVIRKSNIAHKAFVNNGKPYVGVCYSGYEHTGSDEGYLQPTFFLIRDDQTLSSGPTGEIATKAQFGRAPNHPRLTHDFWVANITNTTGNTWVWPCLYRENFNPEITNLLPLGLGRVQYVFDEADKIQSVEMGDSMLTSGGQTSMYDGVAFVEQGFHLQPENTSATFATGVASVTTQDGTYGVAFIYAWVDAQGQRHRSAPTFNSFVATASSTAQLGFSCKSLQHTNKDEVFVEIYLTEANGSVYYKITSDDPSSAFHVSNDQTTHIVSLTLTSGEFPDTTHEILYTQGGVIENIAPPPSSAIAVGKNRVYLVAAEDRNLIWFSKQHVAAKGVEFSDLLTVRVQESGGDITALAELDDKIIVFKEDDIYVFFGGGPNAAGIGNFSAVERVTSNVGCVDQRSLVQTDMGVFFKSKKGIYLLGRNLQVSYVGARVEDFNSLGLTSAVLVEDDDQVRFTHSDGVTLVYDYFFDQWSTFDNMQAVDAVKYQGVYTFLKSDGEVRQEAAGTFQDDGVDISLDMTTAWIKMAGLQGFKRVRRLLLLGEYLSAHTLTVDISYDYDDTVVDTITWTAETPWQLRSHLSQQKCESIKFRIRDTTGTGASFKLSSIALEVAMKRGSIPLKASKTSPAS